MRFHPFLLLFSLLAFRPGAAEAQETPRELNSLPTAPPTPAPAPAAPRQLSTAPVVPDSVREQQRQQQRRMAMPPAETTRFAVGLRNGQVLRAYDVEVKQPVFGRSFLLVDGLQRYDLNDVRYYDDETGHYVRTTLPNSRRETTLRRDRQGRISLYSITSTQYAGNGFGNPYGYGGFGRYYGYGGYPMYRTVKTEYFSKDNGPVQNMTIRNLAIATADNPGSSALLAKARSYQRLTTLSYVAAGGVMLAGLFTTLNPNSSGPAISPLIYAGIPLLIVPLVVGGKQQTSIRQAIALYNRGLQ